VVEGHVPAVGNNAVDELDLARLEDEGSITFVESFQIRIWKSRDNFFEHFVFVNRDHPESPPGATNILGIGVDTNGVLRKLSEQRSEVVDESSVDVISQ